MSMEIIKHDSLTAVGLAAERLKAGGIIIYPTETSYGIGCLATNIEAVKRLYQIKKMPEEKPCLLVVGSLTMAQGYGIFSELALGIADKYWPGPLTLAVPPVKDSGLAEQLISRKKNTVAMRWSSSKFVESLCQSVSRPIVSTSANLSGRQPAFSLEEIQLQFSGVDDRINLVIDAGILPDNKPSTIAEVIGDEVNILRQGKIVIQT